MSDKNINENKLILSSQEKLALLKKQLLQKTKNEDLTFPQSYGQRALYFLYITSPDSTAYNVCFTARIISEINIPALKKSFQRLINRDQSLRSNFKIADGKPVQTVSGFKEICFKEVDVSDKNDYEIKNIVNGFHRTPFDLENGDVFKVYLFKKSYNNFILLISVHHIACDGWSIGIMLNELQHIYESETDNKNISFPPLTNKYSDYVNFQNEFVQSEKGVEQWNYWKEELGGELPALNITPDKSRPAVQSFNGSAEYFHLDKELTDELNKFSKSEGTTVFVTLLTAYFVFLYKYCGQNDIIVGSPTAGRTNTEFDKLIGYFINPVSVRGSINGSVSFKEILKQIRKKVLYAVSNQDFPFPLIVEKLLNKRDPGRSAVFQTFFGMQKIQQSEYLQELIVYNNDDVKVNWGSLTLQPYGITQQDGQFDLNLEFIAGKNIFSGAFKYNRDIFDKETIAGMAENFSNLLKNILSDPDSEIKDLNLLSPAIRNELIVDRNNTSREFDNFDFVHNLFHKNAKLYPEATALISDDAEISYRELDESSNRLANYLIKKGIRAGDLMCICMERSPDMVISILGVLKSGAAYVPVDPNYPADRVAHMISDSGSKFILTQKKILENLKNIKAETIITDDDNSEYLKEENIYPEINSSLSDPAYAIYTSGSTGIPKGVLISHRSLTNHMLWMINEFSFDSSVRVFQKTPFSFDASVWEFYLPLITGGALVIAGPDGHMDTAYMKENIKRNNVNVIQMVPSLLNLFLDEPGIEECKSLKFIFSGGEALTKILCNKVYSKLDVTFCNLYGPTEATIDSTFYICNKNETEENIPIGKPVSNARAYILDGDMNPVPDRAAGELYLGGVNIALGYVNNKTLTDEKFSDDIFSDIPGEKMYRTGDLAKYKFNGELVFLGRSDEQVKFRGFRIELGEIESVINTLNGIKSSIVLLREDKPGNKKLTAYILPDSIAVQEVNEIKTFLKEKLPEYMIPSAFIILDKIPYTPNGKIDKKSLPPPDDILISTDSYTEPVKPVEIILSKIWKDILKIEKVGINDNFFELGGDSIISIQIISRANQEGIKISPKQIFQHQTIAELSAVAELKTAEAVDQNPFTGKALLTPVQQRFFSHGLSKPSLFNHSIIFDIPSELNSDHLKKSFEFIYKHHDALRLSIEFKGNEIIQYNNEVRDVDLFSTEDLRNIPENDIQKVVCDRSVFHNLNIDITKGELIKAVRFITDDKDDDLLLICIHHLCIDGISWRIILEDLNSLITKFQDNKPPELPLKTTSFRDWSFILKDHAQSDKIKNEYSYWKKLLQLKSDKIKTYKDSDHSENTISSEETVELHLTEESSAVILKDIHKTYNTQINDILLTALILAFNKWQGHNKLLLNLEGHGREDISEKADIIRTVGWFTSVYPVMLNISDPSDTGSCIKSVKENLRNIPDSGIGFGLLKYLSEDNELKKSLSSYGEPEILFNYLGQMDFNTDWKIKGDLKLVQDKNELRFHIIEINALTLNNRIKFEFGYSGNFHNRGTIVSLTEFYSESINEIIRHCADDKTGSGYTPSDFSAAGLDQSELDDLMNNLNS
ncbi:MAG: amino acid adenylation domain-containing protein [Ignavibacteria bacterium]|nr:amino acid adenylation domain-containing protein [Ignavibacteria bacterium]